MAELRVTLRPVAASPAPNSGVGEDQPLKPEIEDPGLSALVMLLRFQGIAADAGQLRHRLA